MSEATEQKLARLAERASTPGRKVSPMQMAAQLLEEVVAQLPEDLPEGTGPVSPEPS